MVRLPPTSSKGLEGAQAKKNRKTGTFKVPRKRTVAGLERLWKAGVFQSGITAETLVKCYQNIIACYARKEKGTGEGKGDGHLY